MSLVAAFLCSVETPGQPAHGAKAGEGSGEGRTPRLLHWSETLELPSPRTVENSSTSCKAGG